MELLIKIETEKKLTLEEIEELTQESRSRNISTDDVAIDWLREGLRASREKRLAKGVVQ